MAAGRARVGFAEPAEAGAVSCTGVPGPVGTAAGDGAETPAPEGTAPGAAPIAGTCAAVEDADGAVAADFPSVAPEGSGAARTSPM